ncbi:uncharacterized protein BO95DRAFT_469122 [Aspergillus brunneoviolaceus CBS 621.78]|uniref:Uncharacterized protein n=1 Tax=Aspergillus brunneoviolaceus CBS 621.78 TaxID=1450534 RepID=A0ACD1FSX5_9EURO|nr:hypothetical protein BO95DRAFT_469122 [Aspergillus brunneoviolaceus CBS 621.78]RAH40085.1 hypothetical protein BO95DRAFT_469122 [Aspergillus brunneoviolaceus CBS 621.78]
MPSTPIPRQATNLIKKPKPPSQGLPSPFKVTNLPTRNLPAFSEKALSPGSFSNLPTRQKNNSHRNPTQHASLNPPRGQNDPPKLQSQREPNSKVPVPLLVPLQTLRCDATTLAAILNDVGRPRLIFVVVNGPDTLEGVQQGTVDPAYRDKGRAMMVDWGYPRAHWTAGERLFDPGVYGVIERAVEYAIGGGEGGHSGQGHSSGRGLEIRPVRMRGLKSG